MKITVETHVHAPIDEVWRAWTNPAETFDAENTFSIEQQRQGWQSILDNFKRHVERR